MCKQRRDLAKIHGKVANCLKDFLHKLSRKLANVYDICIENLDMKLISKDLNFEKSVDDNR